MGLNAIFSRLVILLNVAFCFASLSTTQNSVIVNEAPDHVRPYVLPRYRGRATKLTPSQVIRFSITTNSSGGAFSLLQHNGKGSGYASARPHSHRNVHEHFYCARGRIELWSQKNETGASHEARIATPGDYSSVPPNSIHTFQLTDPDTQMTHIFHPAGFEHLFDVFSLGDWPTDGISSPFVPIPEDDAPFGPLTPDMESLLIGLDLYPLNDDQFHPRRDFVNGTAGAEGLHWHDGPNDLPDDKTLPYFIAKDYGVKYLNSEDGYKIIQPLATPDHTTNGDFSIGTIILSPRPDGAGDVALTVLPHHFALQMEDGQLHLAIDGYEPASLIHGDVAFIPANVSFTYHTTVPHTKFMYMNAGAQGLDYQLLKNSRDWSWPAYPEE